MTVNDECKKWFADNAGLNNCFVSAGMNYTDPDGIARTGGTGDVANAFYVAHLIGKDTVIIIANANYTQLKTINGSNDLSLDDVRWVYDNDGHVSGTPAYCSGIPTVTPTTTPTVTPTIPPGSGRINCTTNPSGARIYVNDIDQGINTPAITNYFEFGGPYKVTFKLDGYNDCIVNVSIPHSSIVDATCDLVPVSTGTPTVTPTVTPTMTPTVTPTVTPTMTPTVTPSPEDNSLLILGGLAAGIGILHIMSKRKKRYK